MITNRLHPEFNCFQIPQFSSHGPQPSHTDSSVRYSIPPYSQTKSRKKPTHRIKASVPLTETLYHKLTAVNVVTPLLLFISLKIIQTDRLYWLELCQVIATYVLHQICLHLGFLPSRLISRRGKQF